MVNLPVPTLDRYLRSELHARTLLCSPSACYFLLTKVGFLSSSALLSA